MRVFVKDYNQEVEFPDGTSDDVMSKALKENFPSKEAVIKTMPKTSIWEDIVNKFHSSPVSKDKATILTGLSEQTGVSTKEINRNFADYTGQVIDRTYPTTRQAAGKAMTLGVATGLAINTVPTLIGVGTFMGLDELKNAVVTKMKGDKYQFGAGKGISDLLEAEGVSRDAIDLLEFAAEGWAAGKTSGITKSLANAVRRTPTVEKKVNLINDVAKEVRETGKSVEEVVKTKVPDVEDIPVATPSIDSLEAAVKGGGVRTGDAKYAKESSINLNRLDTTEDVKTFIDMRTAQLAQEIDKKPISWEATKAKVESMGMDWQDVIKNQKNMKDITAWVYATEELQLTMGKNVFDKIRSLPEDKSKITAEMRMDIANDVANHGEVLVATSKLKSDVARALNIQNRMKTYDPELVQTLGINKIMQEVIKKGNLEKDFDNIIDDLKKVDINNIADVSKIMQKYHKAGIMDMIYEGWLNFILSFVKTHVVNVTGSLIAISNKIGPETQTAALLELLRGKNRKVFFGESKAELFGSYHGLKDAGRSFVKAFKTEEPTDMWSKAEIPFMKAIPSKEVTIGGRTFELGGKQVRLPTRILLATDEFFKTLIYRGSLSRQAYNLAQQAKDPNKIAEFLANPTKEMTEKAHAEALYQTFNKPLGEIGQYVMKIRDKFPGRSGYFLVPFIRTATNLTKYAAERTPYNFAKILLDYKAGKISQDELSNEIAKPIVGSILTFVTGMLVKEGLMTGSGPKEKNKRDALQRTGWQPYSLKIGSTYIGYNRYDPLGQIIGTSADMAETVLNSYQDEQNTKQMVGRMALSLSRNWTSKTYMQGISNVIDAVSDSVRYGEKFIDSYAGSLIPSMVAGTARSLDPYYRQTNSIKDILQSRLPVYSEKLFPKRDLWGEPIVRRGGFTVGMLSPSDISVENPEQVNKELLKLGVAPSMPAKKIRGIELTPLEYDVYCKFSGEEAKQRVSNYIESDAYARNRDEINKLAIDSIISHARMSVSNQIWRYMDKTRRDVPRMKKYGLNKEATE